MPIVASGRVRSCTQIRKNPARGLCAKQSRPSAFRCIDELSRYLTRAKTVQIVVAAFGEADELLRFERQREQPFAKGNWNRGIVRAIHDQERHYDPRDPL